MHLELSPDDARFLEEQLIRHLHEVENELVHTDDRQMQREIAEQTRRIRSLIDRLGSERTH
jgi:hypothetical protein